MLTVRSTLGELVAAHPEAAEVLHHHQLDFCCGGHRSIQEACDAAGIQAGALLEEVGRAAPPSGPIPNWVDAPLGDLIGHILERYHEPLRRELPRLVDLAEKVETAHADKPDCPRGLAAMLREVTASVESHLAKEERILFPAIRAGRGPLAGMPIRAMMLEHEDHGKNLRRIREITGDFSLPPHACASWAELYRALQRLEKDLMEHIHLENNVLFPRAAVA